MGLSENVGTQFQYGFLAYLEYAIKWYIKYVKHCYIDCYSFIFACVQQHWILLISLKNHVL